MSMDHDLADIFKGDQFDATRREGRRLVLALAGDIIAYHDALKGAGIADPLLAALVEQFGARWIGGGEHDMAEVTISLDMGEGL